MSATEIDQILAALEELKAEVQGIKAWQSTLERREHDAYIRADERRRWFKIVKTLSESRLAPWLVMAAVGAWTAAQQ